MKMKQGRLALPIAALLSCLAAVVSSCANPLGWLDDGEENPLPGAPLSVRFSFSSDSDLFPSSRYGGIRPTVYPNGDPNFFAPDYYEITAIDPNGGWRSFGTVSPSLLAQGLSGFYEGYWFFDVKAYVYDLGNPIAAGSTAAALAPDAVNTVSIALTSRIDTSQAGTVYYALTVEEYIYSPRLTITRTKLKPAVTGSVNASYTNFSSTANSVWLTDGITVDLPAGMYRMDFVLEDITIPALPKLVWGESQIVYVAPGLTSSYSRVVLATEVGQSPLFEPYVSLGDGVVVENGGEATVVTMAPVDSGAIIVYALNSTTTLGYDPYTGQPAPGCYIYSGPLTLNSAFDALDGASDTITYIKAAAFNPIGPGPEIERTYYHSDAIYADSNDTFSSAFGNAQEPYTDLQLALNRARDLGRSSVTDVRAAVGDYPMAYTNSEFALYGGTRLSGSYDPTAIPWVRSGSLPGSVSGYDGTNATRIIGNATGGGDEESSSVSLRILDSAGKPAFCEYLAIESGAGSVAGSYHASMLLGAVAGPVTIDHVRISSGTGSNFYHSYGMIARASPSVTLSNCHVTGRTGPGSGLGYSTTALRVHDSNVTVTASTLNAGNGFEAGKNYGVNVTGASALTLNGASGLVMVNGATIASPGSSENYGVRVAGEDASANLSYCDLYCGSGNAMYGVAFIKSRGTISHSTVTIAPSVAHAEAIAVSLQAPSVSYPGPLAPFNFIVSESTIEVTGSAIASSLSAGIRLTGGRALIEANSLISGGLAAPGGGSSYGIDISPEAITPSVWAEAEILQNGAIVGKTALVSAGIRATNQVRLLAERNASIRSDSEGGPVTSSRRASMLLSGILRIPGREGLPMVDIRGNNDEGLFGTIPATTNASLYGLYIQASSLSEAIIVERNRISAGAGPGGSLPSGGVYVSLTGTRKAPLVFRNNIVFAGTATNPNIRGMYVNCDYSTGVDARVILANNTIISSTGPGAALSLAGYAKPELYNNTFFKQTGSVGRSVEAETEAAPLAMQFCAFVNVIPTNTYWVNGVFIDPTSNNGMIQENIVHAFGDIGSLFQSPCSTMSEFASFKAEYRTDADEKDRFGGLTLSGTGGPVAPWPFSVDCFGNPREAGHWSRGAQQPTYP